MIEGWHDIMNGLLFLRKTFFLYNCPFVCSTHVTHNFNIMQIKMSLEFFTFHRVKNMKHFCVFADCGKKFFFSF